MLKGFHFIIVIIGIHDLVCMMIYVDAVDVLLMDFLIFLPIVFLQLLLIGLGIDFIKRIIINLAVIKHATLFIHLQKIHLQFRYHIRVLIRLGGV